MLEKNKIYLGDCIEVLKTFPDKSINCCITSPPYYGLRDYGVEGQFGNENSPEEYVEHMVEVFNEVKRVLTDDGTLWLNLGDSWAGSGQGLGSNKISKMQKSNRGTFHEDNADRKSKLLKLKNYKPKDLIGIPWMVAFALRESGWYLRQDIIWCLSGGAFVYVKSDKVERPMPINELVRMKPENVKLWNGEKWTQVVGYKESTDKNEKYELVLRSGERIGCTSEHMWPTENGIVKTKDLKVGNILKSCILPEPQIIKYPKYLTDDLLWFIGLYIAEGSKAGDTIQIALNKDELPWVERIKKMAKDIGSSVTYTIDGNKLNVRVYGKVLNAILAEYIKGSDAHTKHFSQSVWKLPNHALKQIVIGYLDGDGHYDDVNNRIRLGFCRNYALEQNLRTAASRLGAIITLNLSKSKLNGKVFPSFLGEWRWEQSDHHNVKNRNEIVKIKKNKARKFYDIEVEDEPHLFSLASGVLTHNCKLNPFPESVKDRCTKSHEYIFLMSKSRKYYYDYESIKEPAVTKPKLRDKYAEGYQADYAKGDRVSKGARVYGADGMRNKRDVWTVNTKPCKEAHFATFPDTLIEPCILAGCPEDGIVLDPFMGAGTTGMVAKRHKRNYVGIELNPEYIKIAEKRIENEEINEEKSK